MDHSKGVIADAALRRKIRSAVPILNINYNDRLFSKKNRSALVMLDRYATIIVASVRYGQRPLVSNGAKSQETTHSHKHEPFVGIPQS